MPEPFIHPSAIVERARIGDGTRVWAFAHVLSGATIGKNCNICDHSFVEGGAVLGDNVTLKNNVCVWEGITVQDDVFVGPNVCFTNDRYPRSARMPAAKARYHSKASWLAETVVETGVSIGANATIIGGIRLGRYCLVAAGAVVTRDVEPFALVCGAPARRIGQVCKCGQRIDQRSSVDGCRVCGANADSLQMAAQKRR